MEIETLRLLTDVARLGSFAAAARRHDCDPSFVSRQVKAVEAEVGVLLFQRSTRRLSVTEAGRAFLVQADSIVAAYEQALEEALMSVAEVSGRVRLTASAAFAETCLIPLLPAFQEAYPLISLELLSSDAALDLIEQDIDFALRLAPQIGGDVICAKLAPTAYGVYASPEYLEKAPEMPHPKDLETRPTLRLTLPDYRELWRFKEGQGQEGAVRVTGSLSFSSPLQLKAATVQGLGPSLLADWLARDAVEAGALVHLFPTFRFTATSFDTALWLVYSERAHLPQRVRVTMDFFRTHLSP